MEHVLSGHDARHPRQHRLVQRRDKDRSARLEADQSKKVSRQTFKLLPSIHFLPSSFCLS